MALKDAGKPTEAAACHQDALRLEPDYANAHFNLAQAYLLVGRFEEGWIEYEWRKRHRGFVMPTLPASSPHWDGTPLDGRTIYLAAEQGLGDTLQFIRYARPVKERGGRVIVACPKPLVRLLRGCAGIDVLLDQGEAMPPCDVHAPLLSLPGIFHTNLATIPAPHSYLAAEPELVQAMRPILGDRPGLKVGIAWQGDPKNPNDRWRSAPLFAFAPLAAVPGVILFSLQKGPGEEQLRQAADQFPISGIEKYVANFPDTAAVMKNLDLVITVDTAITHLAGALGAPVWVALPFAPDWRWLLDREDSPWYPTMRLYRQKELGNWDEVFERIAADLRKIVTSSRG
jgi:hypothetical protein